MMETVHVEDDVAVVGDVAFAIHGCTAERDECACHESARHRYHLHRQRKLTQYVDQLAVVDDADELARSGRNDLLARQRAAGAFDQLFMPVHFVGAVYVHQHFVHGVQIEHGETMPAQARGRGFRTRDGCVEVTAQRRQRVDEGVGG